MSEAGVLVKFISLNPVDNVTSAAALRPEILIPVGYGSFLTDTMRKRYNFFFHRRQLQTVVADPVQLEMHLLGDIENRLENLLSRYEGKGAVVDIANADPTEALALGTVLRAHKFWNITVLDYRIRDSIFLPLKAGEYMRQLAFPSVTESEIRYLRDGIPLDEKPDRENNLYRKDLNRDMIKVIRSLSVIYAEAPAYWRENARKFRFGIGNVSKDKTEFVLDAASVGIRDSAFEELRDIGVLKQVNRQNSIVHLVFANYHALQMFLNIERVPILNIFLGVALVRAYGGAAAFHDLTLHRYSFITCIRNSLPMMITIYNERQDAEQIYSFHEKVLDRYGEPARKILVRFGQTTLSADVQRAAERFEVEIVPIRQLGEKLEPR